MLSIANFSIRSFVVGFIFSIIIGGIVIEFTMKYLRNKSKSISKEVKAKPDLFLVRIMGLLERISYTTSVIHNQPAWIVAWLAVKVLTRWSSEENRWANISEANIYLIGNLLTVLFGAGGGIIVLNFR